MLMTKERPGKTIKPVSNVKCANTGEELFTPPQGGGLGERGQHYMSGGSQSVTYQSFSSHLFWRIIGTQRVFCCDELILNALGNFKGISL